MTGAGRGLVLVVEDEAAIAEVIELYLRRDGFAVQVESDGEAALAAWRRLHPVAVILDIGLPGRDGADICRTMRAAGDWTPVLFVTARDDEVDRLLGLELGADDYITKPFSPRELVARVRAVFRRVDLANEPGDVIRAGGVALDRRRMQTTVDGRTVDLTPTEFELLATLVRQPGRVFTRAQLLDAIRGVAVDSFERAIDAHVKNLRRKLEPDPRNPSYVRTVYGVGYKFAD